MSASLAERMERHCGGDGGDGGCCGGAIENGGRGDEQASMAPTESSHGGSYGVVVGGVLGPIVRRIGVHPACMRVITGCLTLGFGVESGGHVRLCGVGDVGLRFPSRGQNGIVHDTRLRPQVDSILC